MMGIHEQSQVDSINLRIAKGIANASDTLARRKLLLQGQTFNKSFYDSVQKKIRLPSNPKMSPLMTLDLRKNYDLSQTLKNYKGPIHIIGGRQDYILYNSYEIKLLMPTTEIHWIEECGHWPAFEQPRAFYATLSEILMKVN